MTDYTKVARTKPARPAAELLSQLPSPVGGVILKNTSPTEKDRLRKMGVADQAMLPANFAEISSQAARLAAQEVDDESTIPLPVPADTKPLEINPVDISTMPPAQQLAYKQLIASSLEQMNEMLNVEEPATNMPHSVAAAVRAGSGAPTVPTIPNPAAARPVIDDSASEKYATGAPKEVAVAEEPTEDKTEGNCSRCGFPKHLEDTVELDEYDQDAYFDAIMAGRPFEKSFNLYNGAMCVRVRGLLLEELDAVRAQLAQEQKEKKITTDLDMRVRATQLQNCLQLVSLIIKGETKIACPTSLAEWRENGVKTPGEVHQKLCSEDVLKNLTLYRTVSGQIDRFNALEHKIEQSSRDESFYKAGS